MNILIFIFILPQAFERYSVSASAAGLAYALTASARTTEAVRFNPAGLSSIHKNHLGVGYEHLLSGIEGLHNINFILARPFFFGGLGLEISETGFSEQKEQAVTCAWGIGLNKEFKFGCSADLYLINNARTGTSFSYGLNVGLQGRVSKKWLLGFYGRNLNRPQFGGSDRGTLPYELRAGFGYTPFEDIISEFDLSMYEDIFRIHLGTRFALLDFLNIGVGVRTGPTVLSSGLGLEYKFLKIYYGVEYVSELPLTHIITLNFEF